MKLNKLNKKLDEEGAIISTTASVPDFLKDIEKELEKNDTVNVTISTVNFDEMKRGIDHNTWGFVKGSLTWKIERNKDGRN